PCTWGVLVAHTGAVGSGGCNRKAGRREARDLVLGDDLGSQTSDGTQIPSRLPVNSEPHVQSRHAGARESAAEVQGYFSWAKAVLAAPLFGSSCSACSYAARARARSFCCRYARPSAAWKPEDAGCSRTARE